MSRDHAIVPDESSVLCETCGYTLDGLPPGGKCPECGADIAASREGDGRVLPDWEDAASGRTAWSRFWRTTAKVIFRTPRFYRTLATRRNDSRALRFAQLHWLLSAILLGGALSIHVHWYVTMLYGPTVLLRVAMAASAPLVFLVTWATTTIAARLTAWEAAYRGIRLPLHVVQRGMYYHAAHYLPVGIIVLATTAGNWLLSQHGRLSFLLKYKTAQTYLAVLCIEVLLAAGYLFKAYWAGMKRMMYANR